jgi:SRSO17 transposase
MPVAFRLYLPEVWTNDSERREGRRPRRGPVRTKPEIALAQIRRARQRGIRKAWCWLTPDMESTRLFVQS